MIYSRMNNLVKKIIDDTVITPASKTFLIYLLYQADTDNTTDVTNEEVAEHFDVTPSTVSKWVGILEHNKYITITHFVRDHRIRRYITINPDFLYYKEAPTPKMPSPEEEWQMIMTNKGYTAPIKLTRD